VSELSGWLARRTRRLPARLGAPVSDAPSSVGLEADLRYALTTSGARRTLVEVARPPYGATQTQASERQPGACS
jgi:hypothetical protein